MKRTHCIRDLNNRVGKEVVLSGWVHDVRILGINFVVLRVGTGKVQVSCSE